MNLDPFSDPRKLNAIFAMLDHDRLPREWRDLHNEYAAAAMVCFLQGMSIEAAKARLEAARDLIQHNKLTSHPTRAH